MTSVAKRLGNATRIGAAAAMVAAMTAACGNPPPPTDPSPSLSTSPSPSATRSPASLGPQSVAGLPGWLFYVGYDRVYRLTPQGLVLVLSDAYEASVSPDGSGIAYGDDSGRLYVADADGGQVRALLPDEFLAVTGYEPSWSADSRRLLVGRSLGDGAMELGVVEVASASFTPLPHQLRVVHPMWSAGGQWLGFATGTCQIGVADAVGGNARQVPVFGNRDASVNPTRRRSCDPFSVSSDGSLMAVHQRVEDQTDGDIGRDRAANAVVDTRTGADVPLPVDGRLRAVLFLPDGGALVRSTAGSTTTLTLLGPDLTVVISVTEPAAATETCAPVGCNLMAYVPA
jgi:TolB protein